VNCDRFDAWLDEGRPTEGRPEAVRHAEECPRCAAELAAARELESALRARHESAPPAFADRVIARLPVRVAPPARAALDAEIAGRIVPWWTRALTEPSVVLALVLAGVLTAVTGPLLERGEWMAEAGRALPDLLAISRGWVATPLDWALSIPPIPLVGMVVTGFVGLTWLLWVAGLRLGAIPMRR
jgi:hypothetical protein